MERITELLRSISGAEDSDIRSFLSLHEKMNFFKNDVLLPEGQVENYLYFINKGIIRCYINKERKNDVKEITFNLVFPGWFYSAYDSFITQTPSRYTAECISNVEIYRVSYSTLQHIYKDTNFGEQIGRIISEQLYLTKSKREISLLTDSVDERYLNLLNNYPQELHQVPLKYIASYIGVTPQALSKIRKRVFK